MRKVVSVSPVAVDGWVRFESDVPAVNTSWMNAKQLQVVADFPMEISKVVFRPAMRNVTPSARFKLAHRKAQSRKWCLGTDKANEAGLYTYADLFKNALGRMDELVDNLIGSVIFYGESSVSADKNLEEAEWALSVAIANNAAQSRIAALQGQVTYYRDLSQKMGKEYGAVLELYISIFGDVSESDYEHTLVDRLTKGHSIGHTLIVDLLSSGFHIRAIMDNVRDHCRL